MEVDLDRLNDAGAATEKSKLETLRFALAPDSFFTIVVTNDVLRGPLPGSMGLIPQNAANLPALLNASFHQLVLEKSSRAKPHELVVRDSKSGFVFFNIEGHQYDYDANDAFAQHHGRKASGFEEFAAAAWASVGSWVCRRKNLDCRNHARDRNSAALLTAKRRRW